MSEPTHYNMCTCSKCTFQTDINVVTAHVSCPVSAHAADRADSAESHPGQAGNLSGKTLRNETGSRSRLRLRLHCASGTSSPFNHLQHSPSLFVSPSAYSFSLLSHLGDFLDACKNAVSQDTTATSFLKHVLCDEDEHILGAFLWALLVKNRV